MATDLLSDQERITLLKLARQSLELAVNGKPLPVIEVNEYSSRLRENGASFVTLTIKGNLRGCIGALEPYQPLVQDVCEHAVAAALQDYRFPPVQSDEAPLLEIEISRLTVPVELVYTSPSDLIFRLHPDVDGVILRDGHLRATFLPQVWEKLPTAEEFLTNLCHKMGASGDLWARKKIKVFTYQVEEFHESQYR
jgi:hypothetical protein